MADSVENTFYVKQACENLSFQGTTVPQKFSERKKTHISRVVLLKTSCLSCVFIYLFTVRD